MKTLALWLCVTAVLAPLSLASKGIPSYAVGSFHPSTKYIFKRSLSYNFDDGALVVHFNTCHDYKFKIDKIVVTTTSGISISGHLIKGGLNTYFFGLKVTGRFLTEYDVEVWATWEEEETELELDTLVTYKMYHPCARPADPPAKKENARKH
ncbi:hypothetical protein J6590_067092 [Homalodisca vitripennis]|nr:hypothetical protein J6590_067092 [Homalodisca vitripennis]